jgi:hypothetical protein
MDFKTEFGIVPLNQILSETQQYKAVQLYQRY